MNADKLIPESMKTGYPPEYTPPLQHIPTNLITGFLGAGKTTAIRQLLAKKPAGERWALLINEFGDVGIDAALLNDSAADANVFVKEVPGGCLCCANQLNLQIALNLLLKRARPHRLLIEPTGLGHPRELLKLLQGEYYREVLSPRASLALIDARRITDSRYSEHPIFNQQLEMADVIVASKMDLYASDDLPQLQTFLRTRGYRQPLFPASAGNVDIRLLDMANHHSPHHAHSHHHGASPIPPVTDELPPNPECGYLRIDREGDGFFSSGWIFLPEKVFDYQKLIDLLLHTPALRLKGVFITDQGILSFNRAGTDITSHSLDEAGDSRVERINDQPGGELALEKALTDCLKT